MDPELQQELQLRMAQLPPVVQKAIATVDLQKQMREVSSAHKLHVDQWAKLELEVLMTLLGIQDPSKLATNIENEVGVSREDAEALAEDISHIVFEPIRQELERELEHPDAKQAELTGAEAARQEILAGEKSETVPGVLPATPPAPKPTEKAVRAPISSSYTSREPSTARKDVSGDPYRELPT